MPAEERVQAQLARATQRMAQLRARKLLREMRTVSRQKAKDRRDALRKRLAFGDIVVDMGLGELEAHQLTGLLLDARERFVESPATRIATGKRGREYLVPIAPSESGGSDDRPQ